MLCSIHAWFISHYDFFKDFTGPGATFVAAIVAAVITFRFGQIQAQIARQQAVTAQQQAGIALDQLRYNLFEKRFAIYEAARNLLQMLISDALKDAFVVLSLIPLFVKLDEARFFYPPEKCDFLGKFHMDVIKLYSLVAQRDHVKANDVGRAEIGDKIVDELKRLELLLQAMPERFEADLKFPQLTGSPPR